METSVNNKCKDFTSLEQSKKLAEILPIESADMCYPKDAFEYHYDKEPVCHYSGIGLAHPCWSLSALLNILPDDCGIDKEDGKYVASYIISNECGTYTKDNPVDACYEIIIKLNELKML